MRTRHIAMTLILASLALLLLNLGGCGDETTMSRDDLASGNIRFALGSSQGQISAQSAGSIHTQAVETPLDCTAEGISTIRAIVYGPEGNQLKTGGPWACQDHQGLIEDIPAGTGRTVRILSYSSQQQLVKVGQTSNVEVVADETRNAGIVNLNPFVPQLTSPANGSEISLSSLTLSWQPLEEAASYHLQVDDDINFGSPEVDQILSSTSISPAQLQGDTRYYWQVSALDSTQQQGLPSETRYFTTVPIFIDNDSDGYSPNQGDCNDNNPAINPGATDICGDSIDQDCSGSDETCAVDPSDVDNDGDGFSPNQGDCDDNSVSTYPGANDICGDGIDQDCSGTDEICPVDPNTVDNDSDGYSQTQGDCNDANPSIHPGATDIPNDGIDQDCSGSDLIDLNAVDNDRDGYSENQGDCNDANRSIHPGATDIPNDGIDQDCTGSDLTDLNVVDNDGDGYSENQGDCNDSNRNIHPGATDICGDGIDQDCSGADLICPATPPEVRPPTTPPPAPTPPTGTVLA